MTSTVVQQSADPRTLLGRAVDARAARGVAEVAELAAVAEWATAHVVTDPEVAASWHDTPPAPGVGSGTGSAAVLHGEQALRLGGPGTPMVAEFAVVELSGALEVTHEAALAMVGDALDLTRRLPRTWALTGAGKVALRLARLAASESRDLDEAAAAHADRLLAWQPRRLNAHRVGVLVHEARLYADPDRAVADHDHALARRRVEVVHGPDHPGAPGTSRVVMDLDTPDAAAFDTTVGSVATTLGALGDPRDLDVRRARAVGILADPQRALDLLGGLDPVTGVLDDGEPGALAEQAGFAAPVPAPEPGRPEPGRPEPGRAVSLVLHVTDADLLTGGRPGRDGVATTVLGPVLTEVLAGWLVGAQVSVRPVLDASLIPAVDAHDPPERMAQAVRARDEACIYPGCRRPSARCDLDHTDPYVPPAEGGRPAQTRLDSLAPLCRRHHRAKTFGRFTYTRLPDGSYRWTLPTGATRTTDPPRRRPRPPR